MSKRPLSSAPLALLALAFPLLDCATLSAIPERTCGNGVVDAEEDCDTFSAVGNCGRPEEGARACRIVCDPRAPVCPDGWGCGASGVCREPSGDFVILDERLESGVVGIQVGDFDGDLKADVLATGERGPDNSARARVLYFGEDSTFADAYAFPAPLVTPVVRDIDKSGRTDLAFGLTGLNVALGEKDRTFTPVLFPSRTLPRTEGLALMNVRGTSLVLPSGRLDGRLTAATVTSEKGQAASVLSSFDGEGTVTPYLVSLPGRASDVVGRSAWGRLLDADATSTCGEVVFAMATPPSVVVASPCAPKPLEPTRARWASERALIVIPLGETPTRGVVLADHDVDGHVDILVSGTTDTFLIRNLGGTSFDKPVAAREPKKLQPKPLFDVDGVLAAGDLTGDGFPDYILPRGIQYSVSSGSGATREASYVFAPNSRSPRWSSAIVANLNADAYLDYIASSEESADLEFGSGLPGGVIASTVTTSGVVTHLDVGDVDGDNLTDVVVTSKRPDTKTALEVSFGRTLGPPETARLVGTVDDGATLHVGRTLSVASDVVVAVAKPSQDGGLTDTQIAIVLPSGDRQLLAPLLFPDPGPSYPLLESWRPHAVTIAPFELDTRMDLVSVAIGVRKFDESLTPSNKRTPPPVTVWNAKGAGTVGSFDLLVSAREVPVAPAAFTRSESLLLHATTGDLDRPANGREELVVLTVGVDGDASLGIVRFPFETSSILPVSIPSAKLGPRNQLLVVDVDDDGANDVVAVVGETGRSKAFVAFGDGKGGFDGGPLKIGVPRDEGGDSEIVAATTLVTRGNGRSGDKRTDLVLATPDRLLAVTIGRGRSLPEPRVLASGFDGLTGVGAGDFDGDGVADLAVADKGAVRIVRQAARLR